MKLSLVSRFIQVSLLLVLLAVYGLAQADNPQGDKPKADTDDRAAQVLQRAIQAVGGDRYLAVHTLIGRGFFTDYKDGVPGIPTKFVDYIAYPDRERPHPPPPPPPPTPPTHPPTPPTPPPPPPPPHPHNPPP